MLRGGGCQKRKSADRCLWCVIYWELWFMRGQILLEYVWKEENMGANVKFDYNLNFSISTEFMRPLPVPVSTWCHWLGRNRPEKQVFCWTSGCALRCDLICARSSWTVAIVLRPSTPERAIRSSFHLYDERSTIERMPVRCLKGKENVRTH